MFPNNPVFQLHSQQCHLLLATSLSPLCPPLCHPTLPGSKGMQGLSAPGAEDPVSMKARPESPRQGAGPARSCRAWSSS